MPAQSPQRPNLLFIWTDEQRPDTMACYGNRTIRTPHLDGLANGSFVFDHCYCTQPVCTPSRATIMTGLWPHTHGSVWNTIPLDPACKTIAEMIDPDYHAAYYGKWHLGDEISAQHGFNEWLSIEDAYQAQYTRPEDRQRRSDYHQFLYKLGFPPLGKGGTYMRGLAAMMAEPYTKAGFLGKEASRFIEQRPADAGPWVLSVNFLEPHMPFFGPLNGEYDPDELEVSPAFGKRPGEDMSLRNRHTADKYTQKGMDNWPLDDDQHRRRMRANYDGLVTMVDNAVGRILQALEASGQAEQTIVVFTSDHGEMMGDHAQIAKCVMYEPSISVPLLIRVPWLNDRQQRVPGRFSQIDLLPTLLDLMGQSIPDHLQGVSRVPVLRGEETLQDNDVIVEWNAPPDAAEEALPGVKGYTPEQERTVATQDWRTIITADGWKLNLCATDRCELHDLNEDPWEMRNLIDEPAHRERVQAMMAKVRAWQQATGDTVALPEEATRLTF